MKRRLPKSLRKHIRQEKARIRREVLDIKEQEKLIQELYQKFFEKLKLKQNYENRRNLQPSNK
ncbi:MAG: hypothetical protein E3J36_00810 [Candidatus Nealsonbacteria bacterium]|nr:MAG: hypothetical protein E3J36_00810 [Candidatus Nealsonbacteria bacterium]